MTSLGKKPDTLGMLNQVYSYHIIFRLFDFKEKIEYNLKDYETTKQLAMLIKEIEPTVDTSVYRKTGGFMRAIYAKKSTIDTRTFILEHSMSDLRDIREYEYVNFCLGSIQMKNYKLEPEPPSHFNNKNIIKTINTITPTFKFNQRKQWTHSKYLYFINVLTLFLTKNLLKISYFKNILNLSELVIMNFVFKLRLENTKVTDNT
ncbi:hypothetical protein CDIK_0834 [Cucumispora dikerogammari]|nr:hypothetical protein CDIK_0834 [Cucumispora dikerogammari]